MDSRMLVLNRATDDDTVEKWVQPLFSLPESLANRTRGRLTERAQRGWQTDNPAVHTFVGKPGAGLVPKLNGSDADILNLHWVAGLLSVRDIGLLRKPLVWTMHDMWTFCGGEHYAPDGPEARFAQGYRADNRPEGERGPDLNRQTWEAKRRLWAGQRFTIISPSRWLADCARRSVLLRDMPTYAIPNALDPENLWRPMRRDVARMALGLPLGKRLLLMGTVDGTADPRKGADLLREAIKRVVADPAGAVELVVYGQSAPAKGDDWPCRVHWLGPVRDDRVLALAYSSADMMVVPSRQDNLPNTAVEAQTCGVPVVAFDVGGLPDIVAHRGSGWLAKPFDAGDLAAGILWVLEDEARWLSLSRAARENAVARFSPAVVAAQYAGVYEQVFSGQSSGR
jgi:glycosyltransferase involved in cell wall biosynthesis